MEWCYAEMENLDNFKTYFKGVGKGGAGGGADYDPHAKAFSNKCSCIQSVCILF